MKKISYLFLISGFITFNTIYSQAQSTESSESTISKLILYGDLMIGFTNYATLNMEGKLLSSESGRSHLYLRGGYGGQAILAAGGGSGGLVALTMLKNRGKNYLDISGGVFFPIDSSSEAVTFPIIDIGYRWQKPDGGFIYKAKIGVLGIGFGVGYAF